ncbi:MAG: hypothetical protein ACYDDV_09455 [Methanoregula sp.]
MIKKFIHKIFPNKTPPDKFLDPKKNPLLSFQNLQPLEAVMRFSFSDDIIEKSGSLYIQSILKMNPELAVIIKTSIEKKENLSTNSKSDEFFKNREHPHRNALTLLMIYCISNIYYRSDSSRTAITHLIVKLEFLPIPLLIRSTLELWAAISYVEQSIEKFIKSEKTLSDIEEFSNFSKMMSYGMRYYPEKDGKMYPNPIKIINCLTLIQKLDKKYLDMNIQEDYDYLCEYCHPNAIMPLSTTMMEMSLFIDSNSNLNKKLNLEFEIFFNRQLMILLRSLNGIEESLKAINNLVIAELDLD